MAGLRTVRRGFSDPRVQRSVSRILRENVLCAISTVTGDRRAHIHTAYFAYSADFEFYFLSDANSVHSRNVERNPSMAMAIFRSAQVWGRPDRGIQLFGTCRPANEDDAVRAERVYGRRFPAYLRYIRSTRGGDRRMGAQLRSYRFYRFVPRTVKILDEAEFGGGVFILAAVRSRKTSR